MTVTDGHEEGAQAPFPPAWPGDPHTGHHRSCGVRVKSHCTCGQAEFLARQDVEQAATGRRAELRVSSEYMHHLLNFPADVHLVGCHIEWIATSDVFNVVFEVEAFADGTFPSPHVTAQFHKEWNVKTGREVTIFDGWEAVD